jgi:hypothetical protein
MSTTATPPSAFRKDLERLAQEAEAREDCQAEPGRAGRLAGEEVVGAELLASRHLVAQLGLLWETTEQLGDLYARQIRYWVDDHTVTWTELIAAPSSDSKDGSGVVGRHLERRIAHLGEGLTESAHLLARQSAQASRSLFDLWRPFMSVLRADWADPRSRSRT